MTVGELIEELKKYDCDLRVLIQNQVECAFDGGSDIEEVKYKKDDDYYYNEWVSITYDANYAPLMTDVKANENNRY